METKVIIVDSVPAICAGCDYAEIRGKELLCIAKKKKCYNAKPEWCPLKTLPEKINEEVVKKKAIEEDCYDSDIVEDWYISGKVTGWNSCLDVIAKKKY